jgi:hypothetical protein
MQHSHVLFPAAKGRGSYVLVNAVTNVWIPYNARTLTSCETISFSIRTLLRGVCFPLNCCTDRQRMSQDSSRPKAGQDLSCLAVTPLASWHSALNWQSHLSGLPWYVSVRLHPQTQQWDKHGKTEACVVINASDTGDHCSADSTLAVPHYCSFQLGVDIPAVSVTNTEYF